MTLQSNTDKSLRIGFGTLVVDTKQYAAVEQRIALVDAKLGAGRVILFGFRPQWRGQSHASYKFFMNAFYGE